jgi:xylulokinase
MSDITGRPVLVCAEGEASAAGAAALAWECLHDGQPRAGGSTSAVPGGHEVLPDRSTAAGYDALFAVYRRIYPAVRALFPDLAAAAEVAGAKPEAGEASGLRY